MDLRLLAIDFPPLLRDLLVTTLRRRNSASGRADQAVFVELPEDGADVAALVAATRADVVITPLNDGQWPEHCSRMVGRRVHTPVFGLGCEQGDGRITEVRAIELRRSDADLQSLTLDEFVDRAVGNTDT